MPKQLQAQIVAHGEISPDGVIVESEDRVYAELATIGAWPLTALMEARAYADAQAINEALGLPVQDVSEYQTKYRPDPDRAEVWVDPQEFLEVGVACVYHRHILVKPVIDVSEMPPLVVINGDSDN